MKILALDTATEALSVSLSVGEREIDRYLELDRGHSEQLLPMVEAVLGEAGIALSALDAIAFGRGPGGFTGVRLAASVAQGLAYGAGIGVVPVSNLAAVAQRVFAMDPELSRVLVVNDARMREVYWAGFEPGPHLISMVGEERVDTPAAVSLENFGAEAGRWAAAGRGLRAWPELAERCRSQGATLHPDLLPRAREVLMLAKPQVAAGQVLDPTAALPVYVRDRVAEPAR
jgi:tRNA threonylcarbamoyladenosine biosynthesis protein TsaB